MDSKIPRHLEFKFSSRCEGSGTSELRVRGEALPFFSCLHMAIEAVPAFDLLNKARHSTQGDIYVKRTRNSEVALATSTSL
jgi:hypothetical protein